MKPPSKAQQTTVTKERCCRLLYQEEGAETFLLLSACMSSQEAMADWSWLEQELVLVLDRFESPEEVTDFVTGKIASVVANSGGGEAGAAEATESESYKAAQVTREAHLYLITHDFTLSCSARRRCGACSPWAPRLTSWCPTTAPRTGRGGCRPRAGSTSPWITSPSTPSCWGSRQR